MSRQDGRDAFLWGIETAIRPDPETGSARMTKSPMTELTSEPTAPGPNRPFLTWYLDPRTGKPVAYWTVEQLNLEWRLAA